MQALAEALNSKEIALPSFPDVVLKILSRLHPSEREGLDLSKKVRLYAGEDVEGFTGTDVDRIRAESPDEGLDGVSPRFVINALSNAISRSELQSLTSMEL